MLRGYDTRKATRWLVPPVAFRRKRCIPFAVLVGISFVLFTLKWPGSVMDSLAWGRVEEIYGFLHVITSGNNQGFNSPEFQTNPYTANDISLYAGAEGVPNWGKEKARIEQDYPVIVFSKTYCPYSQRAKTLLATYDIQPPPKIIEVDLREDGMLVKQFLIRMTQHRTFPNIIIRGRSIGGSDNLQQLHDGNGLRKILVDAGAMTAEQHAIAANLTEELSA